MLGWRILFLIVALIAGTAILIEAADEKWTGIAKLVFVIFMILFIISTLNWSGRRKK